MKKILILILLISSLISSAQDKSVKPQKLKKIKSEWVKLKLPKNFIPMEDEAFFRNVASTVKPEIAYRDPSAQISFTINNSVNRWGRNLVLLQQFQKSTILRLHKKVTFLKEEIIEVKKRKYLIMVFDSKIDDKTTPDGQKRIIKNYNYQMYTVKDGHLITISMRLPNWMKAEGWDVAADEIFKSIRVK